MPFLAENHYPIPTKDILSWTFDDPKYDQDMPIYIDAINPSRSISCRQAKTLIRKIVAGLHQAGLKQGDCVLLHSFNDIYYSIFFLGIIAAGGIYAGSNPAYTQFELTHHIKTSQAKFVIVEPEILDGVLKAADECKIPKSNIWIFNTQKQAVPKGFRSYEDIMKHGEKDWVRFDDKKTAQSTTAARLFSSGTTGLPKAATLTHYNFVAQHTLVHEYKTPDWQKRRLVALPMFHAATVPVAHTTPLRGGHQTYVMRRFELEPYLASVQKYQITDMALVPPLAIAIIMSPLNKKYSLKSVRTAACGAAPMSKETQARLQTLLADGAIFNQVWGMTETSCVATTFYYPEHDTTGSVGRPMPGLDVKITDDQDKDITGYNVKGELCVRGPIVIPEYFNNPKANAESFDSEGYFRTGDIVYCDKKTKKWYVIDRKKELIKVRGFQVAPPELESVLLSHPQVVDAAVIGVHKAGDEDKNEHPRAYVVRRPGDEGAKLSEKDVLAWMDGKLAKFKQLTGGVVFVDAIPKNASGKILKRVLRDEAKAELKKGGAKL